MRLARALIAPIAVVALVGCGSTNAGVSSIGAGTAAANTTTSTGDTASTSAADTTLAAPTTAPAATTLPAATTTVAGVFTIPQAPPATVDPASVTTTAATPAPTQAPIDTGAPGVFTSDAAQFSIQFEATPSQTDASKNGVTVTLFDVSTRTHEQTVSVLAIPKTNTKSHAALLDQALQGSVNSGSMTDLTKQSTTFQGQDALEFSAKISPNLTVLGRLVVTSARLYEELFVFDDSTDRSVAGHQFLDTLTLLGL